MARPCRLRLIVTHLIFSDSYPAGNAYSQMGTPFRYNIYAFLVDQYINIFCVLLTSKWKVVFEAHAQRIDTLCVLWGSTNTIADLFAPVINGVVHLCARHAYTLYSSHCFRSKWAASPSRPLRIEWMLKRECTSLMCWCGGRERERERERDSQRKLVEQSLFVMVNTLKRSIDKRQQTTKHLQWAYRLYSFHGNWRKWCGYSDCHQTLDCVFLKIGLFLTTIHVLKFNLCLNGNIIYNKNAVKYKFTFTVQKQTIER